ncbi:MAG TPA: hypothetical protein DDW33_14585, partial [Ktedonobacter sp.]|nr:hypothetical protein [Ktedonobacter sp.]
MYTCATRRCPIHALNHSRNNVHDKRFIHEEMLVSRETKNRQNVVALPLTEVSVLEELDALLLENGSLKEGEAIPVVSKDRLASNESTIGYYAENNAVVALSVRYCALTALPESLGQLSNLQYLDMTGNQLTSLPEALGSLVQLRKLYLDENQLASLPESLGHLTNLHELHVDKNLLASLPTSISQLIS